LFSTPTDEKLAPALSRVARFRCNLAGWWRIACPLQWSDCFTSVVLILVAVSAAAQYYFRFWDGWRHCFQKVKQLSAKQISTRYLNPWLRYIALWTALFANQYKPITTSGLEKLTSAILEFWFSFRPYHRNRHVILHQLAKSHQNRATRGWVMTSSIFKTKAAATQYYFRFRIGWCRYQQTITWPVHDGVADDHDVGLVAHRSSVQPSDRHWTSISWSLAGVSAVARGAQVNSWSSRQWHCPAMTLPSWPPRTKRKQYLARNTRRGRVGAIRERNSAGV